MPHIDTNRLSRAAKQEAGRIGNRIQEKYLRHRRLPKEADYPAVPSACCTLFTQKIYVDHSRGVIAKHLNKQLRDALENIIGPINGESPFPGCKSRIGHCAEQHAADKLLKDQPRSTICDIYFGNAYRPRTGTIIAPCDNCTSVFPNL